jgi:hypothetical protein
MVCQWFDLKITVTVFSGLTLKPMAMVSSGVASKLVARVFRFRPQNQYVRFGDLDLKITMMVFWFGHQNQAASVCRLRHKTDGGRTVWDTCQELVACFTWKKSH